MSITDKIDSVETEASRLHRKFTNEWGGFRRWLAKHPLSGFWAGVGAGVVVGGFIAWIA